jgi:hypothetical protein
MGPPPVGPFVTNVTQCPAPTVDSVPITGTRGRPKTERLFRRTTYSLLVVALCLTGSAAAWAVPKGSPGRIAFERHEGNSVDIHTIGNPFTASGELAPVNRTDGSELQLSRETDPTWAPPSDEPALAFESDRGGDLEIYWTLAPAPAPDPPVYEQFTDNAVDDTDPAWAPEPFEGDTSVRPPIAFVRSGDIFIKSFDERVESSVTSGTSRAEQGQAANPDWSPDGKHLAFETFQEGKREIWVMRISYEAGTFKSHDPRAVTPGLPPSSSPSWVHYRQIPEVLDPPVGEAEGPTTLPGPTGCVNADPLAMCRDAEADRIAFAAVDSEGEGDSDIFFASAEAPDVGPPFAEDNPITYWLLTDNTVDDAAPAWSPNGGAIVFQRSVGGASQLHVMEQDGEGEKSLLIARGENTADRNPAWEPEFLRADVVTRRPCGRFSNRRRCKRAFSTTGAGCTSQPCPPPECPSGGPPPCTPPPECPSGGPPPCTPPPLCPGGNPPPCFPPIKCGSAIASPCPPTSACTEVGDPGPDRMVGGPDKDVLCGMGGDDRLTGAGGNDVLRGGGGSDRLRGGPGKDELRGGRDADALFGQAGSDRVFGGPAGDSLIGGPGFDRLFGESGKDRIDARDRRPDRISGGRGRDSAVIDRREELVGSVEVRRKP